jgi:DNA-binding SARP family transcriptional activator
MFLRPAVGFHGRGTGEGGFDLELAVAMGTGRVWFSILGPVRAWREGTELDVGSAQARALLGLLLAHAGQPVAVSAIVDTIWGQVPPETAINAVRRTVGQLRRAIEPNLSGRDRGRWVLRSVGGYRLAVDADTADLMRFRQLVNEARLAAGVAGVELYGNALQLWRGEAGSGICSQARSDPAFLALDREYLVIAAEAADAALAVGAVQPIVSGLQGAADRAPLDQALQARLTRVLAAAGQPAQALSAFQATRMRLVEELGIDPGPELVAAHEAVLERSPQHPEAPDPSWVPVHPVPAQLPADPPAFVGRPSELKQATTTHSDGQASGTAGIKIVGRNDRRAEL